MLSQNTNRTPMIPGSMIQDYRLTERIGTGGFSEVWSAWDERLKRVVAIKIVPLTIADGFNAIQFKRESMLISHLEHPHILPLYDFGTTRDFRFLVMRYVTGGSLAQRLETQRLSISKILSLMMPTAMTLDYLHEQHIVHRDLKPGNILIDARDMPYLTDFGLAKSLRDTTTPMHSVSGTLTYMPPEQFTGGVLSIQSDQFSFGIMLFQLFTGTLPYDGQPTFGMRQLTSNDPLPDVTQIDPTLPTKLNDYLQQLTAASPADRPASATSTMQAIAALFPGLRDQANLPITPHLTVALESASYRQQEAENLLKDALTDWEKNQFTLSATHYLLLNMLLPDLKTLLTPAARSLMIRGMFEYNIPSHWWEDSPADAQQQACWHAIRSGNEATRLQALKMATRMPWSSQAPLDILDIINPLLMPMSDSTALALDFFDRALPTQSLWLISHETTFSKIDDNLCQLATSQPLDSAYSNFPNRAAHLIGQKRRTAAVKKLSLSPDHLAPLLTIYEQVGSLPSDIPTLQQAKIAAVLAVRQLTTRPAEAFRQYLWAVGWNIVAFALMILIIGWPRFIDLTQLLNHAISYGLLYGLMLGTGVWIARHISLRLVIVGRPIRFALGIITGGVIIAIALMLYNQVALDNSIDGFVALYSGLFYVCGFVISVTLPIAIQWLCGASGITLALMIPWINYLQNDNPPVIDFGDLNIGSVMLLTVGVACTAALLTIGAWKQAKRWEPSPSKMVNAADDRVKPAPPIA